MARAEVASASVSSDSIKGLAQSIAKPAYRRLLTAEPALRRAVPALIIAFLVTICVGAIVQVLDHRRQAAGEVIKQIEATADFLVERLGRLEQPRGDKPDRRLQTELERMMPLWTRAPGRQVIVANSEWRRSKLLVAHSRRLGSPAVVAAANPWVAPPPENDD